MWLGPTHVAALPLTSEPLTAGAKDTPRITSFCLSLYCQFSRTVSNLNKHNQATRGVPLAPRPVVYMVEIDCFVISRFFASLAPEGDKNLHLTRSKVSRDDAAPHFGDATP